MTRVRTLERLSGLRDTAPLLFAAIPHIGHFQIRNRGAVGGSIAHADPAAELPAVAVALGAELVAASTGGGSAFSRRRISSRPTLRLSWSPPSY